MATKPNPDRKKCSAKSKRTGEQCTAWAVRGFDVCRMHGAGGATPEAEAKERMTLQPGPPAAMQQPPPPPPGHQRARKHGGYSSVLLPDEQAEKDRLVEKLGRSLGKMDDFDHEALGVLCLCLTKVHFSAAAGAPAEAVLPWAKHAMEQMRELKATRASREPQTLVVTTPAQLMAQIMDEARRNNPKLLEGYDEHGRRLPPRVVDVPAVPAAGPDASDASGGGSSGGAGAGCSSRDPDEFFR